MSTLDGNNLGRDQIAQNQTPPGADAQPNNLDQVRQVAYTADGRDTRVPQRTDSQYVPQVTQIADRLPAGTQIVGKDGQPEAQPPIAHVVNYGPDGRTPVGTSEYKYSPNPGSGEKLNGYVDRDANNKVTEFVVRLPATHADQKDVFLQFKATPGHPIDEARMNQLFKQLDPSLPKDQQLASQRELNSERPMPDNLVHNVNNQIVSLRLDPQTGQRFAIHDQRFDPKTQTYFNGPHAVLTWQDGNGANWRCPVDSLRPSDQDDIRNSQWHGNLRTPLALLKEGGPAPQEQQHRRQPQPQPMAVRPS